MTALAVMTVTLQAVKPTSCTTMPSRNTTDTHTGTTRVRTSAMVSRIEPTRNANPPGPKNNNRSAQPARARRPASRRARQIKCGIAKELFLGETTVKSHLARVFTKLELRDRVQAVVFAYEAGLVRSTGPRTPPP